MFRLRPFTFALAAALAACLPAHAQLPEPVTRVLQTTGIGDDAVSVLVLRDDKTVLSHLADRPMQPASTMKLVSTLVGLEVLGPVFRGRTELRTTGEQQGDTLKGDLVLRGGADVDLSGEALENMLRSLRYQGIRKIQGRLVVDRQLFNPARTDLGAPPFDESPEAYYNVIPDAAMINKNMLQLDMRSTGKRLALQMQPALQGVTIGHDMKLVDADCKKWEDGWKLPEAVPQKDGGIKVMLHGTFPKNCNQTYSINVVDRQAYVDRLFRATWKRLGGTITGTSAGTAIEGATPPESRLLAEHVSRTLPEIVRDTNKPSDNLFARLIFLSLGALEADPVLGSRPQAGSAEPTLARSDAVVRNWMRAHGIKDTGLVLENGSGLSRTERITAVQMAALLQAGLRSPWAPEFQSSMPIAGVDGTLRRRIQNSPATGRARMKTGTLSNGVALAGYVPDATGKPLIVVAMINSPLVGNGRGRAVLDTLIDWVARLGGPAQPLLQIPGQAAPSQTVPGPEPTQQGMLATPPAQPAQPLQPAQPQTQPQQQQQVPQQGQDGMQRQPAPAPAPAQPALQPAGAGR